MRVVHGGESIITPTSGKEVLRVVGYESADKFLRSLDRVSASGA